MIQQKILCNNQIKLLSELEDFLQIEKNLSKNTIQAYISDVKDFLLYFDINLIENKENVEIKINEYIDWLKKENIKASSVARKVSSIKQFYKLNGIKIDIKTAKINQYINIVDYNLIINLIEQINDIKQKTFLYLLFATGGRVSEVLNVKINTIHECIKMQKLHFNIVGKGKKERVVFITEKTLTLLEKYLLQNNAKVFLFENKINHKPLTRQWAHKILKQLCIKMNITHLHPHDFRHAQAMLLLEAGVDLITIKEILGHSHLSTTERYLQLHWKHLEQAIKNHPLNNINEM